MQCKSPLANVATLNYPTPINSSVYWLTRPTRVGGASNCLTENGLQPIAFSHVFVPQSASFKTVSVWPSMLKDIANGHDAAFHANDAKSRGNREPHTTFAPTVERFQHVHIDLVGPFPPSGGFTFLLTCIDRSPDGRRLFRQ
ncbi:hypothetical protein TNIN_485231 [Trichonephila inaurata madagascariensis]|uniref:Uncharacterized protein n=1 Tax=Trichonephila inaurata madagascariensis TaxID=2747483 RepID=A0A8X6MCK3_9ARAC|nr:hypothetical protein TNIN_485231 [Trichonephila inaurata madagascariensis]